MDENKVLSAPGGGINKNSIGYQATLQNKKWDECTSDEKLEKLRRELYELRHLGTSVRNLGNQVQELTQHTHADGKVVVPMTKPYGSGLENLAQRYDYLA